MTERKRLRIQESPLGFLSKGSWFHNNRSHSAVWGSDLRGLSVRSPPAPRRDLWPGSPPPSPRRGARLTASCGRALWSFSYLQVRYRIRTHINTEQYLNVYYLIVKHLFVRFFGLKWMYYYSVKLIELIKVILYAFILKVVFGTW